jgi:hypothetical protein
MKPDDFDEELLYLVAATDKELFDAGLDIERRSWEVPHIVMKKLGYTQFVLAGSGTPKVLERIRSTFASIYRKQDIQIGGHIGVFMYRDIFARIDVPRVFGEVGIDPFEFVELTPIQLRIMQIEPDQIETYLDQFCDLADVEYGAEELKEPFAGMELVARFIGLSRLNLHSASAVLTGGYDHRGAVQAALLATELALKAGAAAQGLSEQEIKDRFGHRNNDIADSLATGWPSFDLGRVKRVLTTQPSNVLNRYSATHPNRRQVGHIVMGAQYLVSEVVRQLPARDFRSGIKPAVPRRYPANA